MENWFKKYLRHIAFGLLFLLVMKNAQSCNRKMSLRIAQKNHIEVVDSLGGVIDSLRSEIVDRNYRIREVERDGSEKLAVALSETSGQSSVNIESLLRQLDRSTQENSRLQKTVADQKAEISKLLDTLKTYEK
jgi:hypothetical protein